MEFLGLTTLNHLWLFFWLVLGIIAIPGMDMAFIMASTLSGGRKLGFSAVAGIVAGGVVHVAMAIMGVGLILKTLPWAFNIMILIGSAYMIWIGAQLFRGATALSDASTATKASALLTLRRAVITCLLNPKAYMFMLAIFPQFIRPDYGPLINQALALGLIIALTQIVVYGAVVFTSSHLRQTLHENQRIQIRMGQTLGILLIAIGVWAMVESWSPL